MKLHGEDSRQITFYENDKTGERICLFECVNEKQGVHYLVENTGMPLLMSDSREAALKFFIKKCSVSKNGDN